MNYFYAVIATGIILFTGLLYGLAYTQGYHSAQSEYESKLQASANTGVPSKAPVRSDLICYSEAELLKKIKRSLDITEECDKLAYRYNTLLSVCKGE